MPQGSVVGPFGFTAYSAPRGKICQKYGVSYHFYADDSQLYMSFSPEDEDEARQTMEACIAEVKEWMQRNHLKMNDSKTEFIVFGSKTQLRKLKHI